MRRRILFILFLLVNLVVTAQNHDDALAKQLVTKNASAIGLSRDNLNNYIVSNSYFNQPAGTQMVYLQQSYKGLPIYNQLLVLAFKDQKLISKTGEFLPDLTTLTSARSASPGITPDAAVRTAITEAKIAMPSFVIALKTLEAGRKYDFGKLNNLTSENVTAELMWVPVRDIVPMDQAANKIAANTEATGNTGNIIAVKLAWQVQLYPNANADFWNIRVDAATNTVIEKNNLTVYENFDHDNSNKFLERPRETKKTPAISIPGVTSIDGPTLVNTANYTVIPYPAESPNHPGGTAAVRTNPWNLAGGNAVTLGWHNDGALDYTYSRGNNVWAQEDRDNNNTTFGIPANSTTTPDPLNFTYPINYTTPPITADFQQFATTNLFYWNNLLHDLNYNYGFTEPAGNFQNNNLGRGGAQNDYVIADAQDAGGINNANMATGADGIRPRMQMYLWDPAQGVLTFVVNSPAGIAGPYNAVEGAFSTNNLLGNVGPVTGQLVWYNDDAAGNTHYACNAPANSVAGKVALIVRGFGGAVCTATVPFTQKVLNAQNAGAIGVVVVNNVPGPPIVMGGADNTITIPAIMISDADGALIAAQVAGNVNVTMSATPPGTVQLDGDLDNGIVAHEFFHGVSNRLTGGPANPGCLSNAEQGGEGWSDYMALMITTNWATALPTDGANKTRPIGTYAGGQTINGSGIRIYPYTTNIAVNPHTYASLGVAPVGTAVHNIGEVWCTMLWEMTWGLIQTDGINPNIFNAAGAGGNTVAYRLVMEGMKLQPCSPGFVDARNAIMQADQNLYGGAHYCTLWAAFAKRGMGVNASQGSSFSATDQVADFTTPAGATITSQPANSTACNGTSTSFTVGATGGGTVTYQWQISTTGAGGPWSNVTNVAPYSGATTLTLAINPVTNAMNGYQYRLVITSACGTTTSNPAVLTVIAAAVGGTVTPASTTVCSIPNSITLTLTGNIGPVTRWESSTTGAGGPFTTPIANTTNTLTVTNVTVTTWYRAVVQGAGCAAANSSVAVVTVLPGALQMYIAADPGTTVCAGDPTRLTAMESAGVVPVTVSHSSSNTVAPGSVSCGNALTTAVNSFWRAYDLSTFPAVSGNFTINTVTFGIESATGGPQNIIIRLYTQTGGAFPGGVRTQIATQTFSVPNQALTLFTGTLTTPVTVANNSVIIVEAATAGAANTRFFIGSNAAAETGPSYLSATACAINVPTTTAAIGFPNMHIILSLGGTVQTPGTQVSGGTFLWSPAAGLSSTSTNPVAASPATTTTYTVTHNNGAGCIRTATILINVNQRPAITTQPANVTVCNGTTASFTAAATGAGITYQWQLSTTGAGGPWTNLTNTAPYSGVTTTTLTVTPVTMAMNGYQYRLVVSGTCPVPANSTGAILTVNALPTVTITPAGPVCGGIPGINGVMLTTGGGTLPPVPGSVNVNSGPISIPIPDPSPGMSATTDVLNVAGIPANATITGVSVTWTLPHTYPADLVINLKAPNNNILSLYKHNTQTDNGAASIPTAGFFNAVVNNTSAVQFKSVPTPYRYGVTAPAGPYAPDVLNGSTNPGYPAGSDPVGYVSNATGFSGLYTTGGSANGAWTLAMADAGGGDAGTLQNWQIKIDYTTPNPSVPISYTWAPAAGLFTDPTATTPYVTGTQTPTVYAAPTTNTVYTVTALENATGCTNTATVTVNYTPNAPTVSPTSATMCLGDAAVPLTITSSLAPTTVTLTNSTPVAIPDNTANGVTSVINVAGVPVGAVISSMAVTLNMPHTYPADMVFNLRAPNGQIFNLFKHNTNTNSGAASVAIAGFFNAVVNSTGTVVFSTVPTPYQYGITVPAGPFRPDALNGAIVNPGYTIMDPVGFVSNAANFAALYSTPNGAWTLAMCDGGPADLGTLNSWTLSFTYGTPAGGIWSPLTGLFADPGAAVPYTGTSVQTVYAKPAATTTYSVVVSTGTCTSPARTVTVTVNNPIAITSVTANQNICTDKVASFTVAVTGTAPTYQWQVSTDVGNTWNNIVNGGVYSGATSATLTITAPPVSMNGYQYRVVVSGAAPCAAATSASRLLTVNPLPTIVISANPYTRLLPGMITNLTSVVTPNPAGAGGYTWLRDGIPVLGAATGSLSVGVDVLGDYSLRVTDVNGCTSISNTVSIRDSASGKCFIYPNPNSGQFQVRYYSAMNNTGLPRALTVFDGKGNRVLSQNYTIGRPYDRMDVDMRKYGKGLYWVEVSDMNGNRLTMCRIVIQ